MSTNKRKHAAEAFLGRMGTKPNENEQNNADADEQNFVMEDQQKNEDAREQNSKDANIQASKDTKVEKMRRITFNIPESLYKQLKRISIDEDITLLDIGAAMAREYVERKTGRS